MGRSQTIPLGPGDSLLHAGKGDGLTTVPSAFTQLSVAGGLVFDVQALTTQCRRATNPRAGSKQAWNPARGKRGRISASKKADGEFCRKQENGCGGTFACDSMRCVTRILIVLPSGIWCVAIVAFVLTGDFA